MAEVDQPHMSPEDWKELRTGEMQTESVGVLTTITFFVLTALFVFLVLT